VEVGSKYAGVFIDGAVLDDDVIAFADLNYVTETLVQEINLEVERPPFHIFVEVCQIGIEIHWFEPGSPMIMIR
jgi:hypothetical protein